MDGIINMQKIYKYQILKQLGEGNYGKVYKVFDETLKTEKALKIIQCDNEETILKNLNEAQVLYQCKHKHIVNINEANIITINKRSYLCIDMELVNGGSVEHILNTRYLSVVETIRIFIGVLQGLEFAHNLSYLHRDIKPANILLDENLNAKDSDFGLAYNLRENLVAPCFGYLTHFAPESCQNHIMSKQTDIYAAGVTLFRMVNNLKKWKSIIESIPNNKSKISSGILLKTIGFQPYMPKKIIRIINKATNVTLSKRYKSITEFKQALEKLHLKIKWEYLDDLHWKGRDLTDNRSIIELVYDEKNKYVFYKKNKRINNSKSKHVSSKEKAKSFIDNFIAENTIS
ncbi:MAG: hypothetical protein BKP49_10475 [Treponema sp. CETP13]|nr:MAG: hypothetical protein BKP49_10475 [Treponema sp. CETP13]